MCFFRVMAALVLFTAAVSAKTSETAQNLQSGISNGGNVVIVAAIPEINAEIDSVGGGEDERAKLDEQSVSDNDENEGNVAADVIYATDSGGDENVSVDENGGGGIKRFYVGIRFGGSIGTSVPKMEGAKEYYNGDDVQWWNGGRPVFDVAPFISWQLTDKFALQTEVMITRFFYEGKKYNYDFGDGWTEEGKFIVSRAALVIPLLAKYTLRANDKISFQVFAGPHLIANVGRWKEYRYEKETDDGKTTEKEITNFTGSNTSKVPIAGFTAGTNFGIITKAGTIFLDARFAGDMGVSKEEYSVYDPETEKITQEGWSDWIYRSKFSFSLGYEYGFRKRTISEIYPQLKDSPSVMMRAYHYRKVKTAGAVSLIGGSAMAASGAIMFNAINKKSEEYGSSGFKDVIVSSAFIGVGALWTIPGIPLFVVGKVKEKRYAPKTAVYASPDGVKLVTDF